MKHFTNTVGHKSAVKPGNTNGQPSRNGFWANVTGATNVNCPYALCVRTQEVSNANGKRGGTPDPEALAKAVLDVVLNGEALEIAEAKDRGVRLHPVEHWRQRLQTHQ